MLTTLDRARGARLDRVIWPAQRGHDVVVAVRRARRPCQSHAVHETGTRSVGFG